MFFFFFPFFPNAEKSLERDGNGSHCGVRVLGTSWWLASAARKGSKKEESSLLDVERKRNYYKGLVWFNDSDLKT